VRLIRRQEQILEVEGVDMFDGTPLLDLKPYVPDFDVRGEVRTGWYASRGDQEKSG
jgi:tRNA (Thr-GGU) A37 N-methylase